MQIRIFWDKRKKLYDGHKSALTLLILFVFLSLPFFSYGQATILKNVTVIDVVNEQILPARSLEVRDGIIHKIHDQSFVAAKEDTVIDLTDKFVIPGLIDSHTHIEHSAYWPKESKYNPPRKNIVELLRHALYGGVTGIREMASDARVVGELSRLAKINSIASPDIYYSSIMGGPSLFDNEKGDALTLGETAGNVSWARAIKKDTNLPRIVAEAKGNGSHALKLYAFLDAEQIKNITEEAHTQDMKVWAHPYLRPVVASEIVAGGVDGISHASGLLYEISDDPDFSTYPDQDEALQDVFRSMKSKGISLDPTIFVSKHAPWSSDAMDPWPKLLPKKPMRQACKLLRERTR